MTTVANTLEIDQNNDHDFTVPFEAFDINTMFEGYRFVQPTDLKTPLKGVWMWNQNTTIIDVMGETTMFKSCFNYDMTLFETARTQADSSFEWLQTTIYQGYWIMLIPVEEKPIDPSENVDDVPVATTRKRSSTTTPSTKVSVE